LPSKVVHGRWPLFLRARNAPLVVERSVPLAQVRDLLGHASILTTERYDNQRLEALQAAVERLEGGKTFDRGSMPRTTCPP
jgi:site-specific recombinase XerD